MDKKINIILYGVRCNRLYFERNLNNKYQIVGYTDGSEEYKDLTEFDYLPYYTIDKLHLAEFDYIVILPGGKSGEIILNRLLQAQVPVAKIIEYGIFSTSDFRNPMREYVNLNRGFDGFVFGMSHSYHGFLTHWFDKKLFKFSSPSMDLYYHAMILKYLIDHHKETLMKGKNNYFVFDLPYYVFNFDVSKATNLFRSRLNYFEPFEDYHNYITDERRQRDIQQYKIVKDIRSIDERVSEIVSNNYEKKSVTYYTKSEIEEVCKEKPHVLYTLQEDTIKENIEIWKNILQMIKEINENAKIAILIYPHHPYFVNAHQGAIDEMKKFFYENIMDDSVAIEIFDYYDSFSDEDTFLDHYHLNGSTSVEFSKQINNEFKNKIYE